MIDAELRERVEKFVRVTPEDAKNTLLVGFFMSAIRAQKGGSLAPSSQTRTPRSGQRAQEESTR